MVQWFQSIRAAFLAGVVAAFATGMVTAQSPAPQGENSSPSSGSPTQPTNSARPGASSSTGTAGPVPGLDVDSGIPVYETIQEDWSSLAIGASHLEPTEPIVGNVDPEEK